jgi:hypothetical protein
MGIPALKPEYFLELYDPFGKKIDELDQFWGLKYTRVVNDVGELNVVLPGTFNKFKLERDYRIGVQRRVGYAVPSLDTETPWLIRGRKLSIDDSGRSIYTVKALSANHILTSRQVAYNAGTTYARKTDYADDMMKDIVRENMGSSAVDTTRSLENYLTVQADLSDGPSISKEFSWQNVNDVLKEISDTTIQIGTPVFFDIVDGGSGVLKFRTYRDYRGSDRRISSQNPIIIGPDLGNGGSSSLSEEWSNEVSYAYSMATGVGDARLYGTASDDTVIGSSPFGRREFISDAGQYTSSTALVNEAKAALRSGRALRSFEVKIISSPNTIYGVHWKWGDYVTGQIQGQSFDCRVQAVSVSVDAGKEQVEGYLRLES